MGVFTDHSHTAITQKINNIIETDLEPEIELPELLDTIKLQYSGAIEAARAIRKKLKYGKLSEQLKSIDVLNVLVINGGRSLEEIYNDKKLLERLKLSATDATIDTKLRKKIILSAIAWHDEFQDSKSHYGIANLKQQLPLKSIKKKKPNRDDFLQDEAYHSDEEFESSEASSYSQPSRSSRDVRATTSKGSKSQSSIDPNKKYKIPKINLEKEAPKIRLIIAESSTASINLKNVLKSIRRDQGESVTDNQKATQLFEKTRIIRRKLLRYLQLVDSEEFLGSLIHANEELVDALQLYTQYVTESGGADSDDYSELSDDDDDDDDDDLQSVTDSLASSMIEEHERRFPKSTRIPPPIPGKKTRKQNVNDDDPFGDSHVVDESVEWK